MSTKVEGGCLCGAVRFIATGEPIGVAWCHCQSCRKHSGAPVSVFVAFRRDAYAVTKGEITKFNSSPCRWRRFCARCGSTLTCEGESSSEMHFMSAHSIRPPGLPRRGTYFRKSGYRGYTWPRVLIIDRSAKQPFCRPCPSSLVVNNHA